MNNSIKSFVISSGLALGIIMIMFFLIEYLFNIDALPTFINFIWVFIKYCIAVAFIIYFALNFRKKYNEGYLSFKEAFSMVFGVFAFSNLIRIFFLLIFMNFIDVTFATEIQNKAINDYIEQAEYTQQSEDQIDSMVEKLTILTSFSFFSYFISYVFTLILLAPISLIIGAIIQNKKPQILE